MAAGSELSEDTSEAEKEARTLQLLREFDEKRLATPQDWADMEDFDEDAVIASMTKRVEETWLETQRELQAEKAANGGKSSLIGSTLPIYKTSAEQTSKASSTSGAPAAPPARQRARRQFRGAWRRNWRLFFRPSSRLRKSNDRPRQLQAPSLR